MTKRKDGLTYWREIQQTAFEEEQRASVQALRQLENERDRLARLDSFQQNIHHRAGSHVSALELQGNWQFGQQLEKVIRHQRQQLAMEQAQYRRRETLLIEQQRKLKTADTLLQKRLASQQIQYQRREQKNLDELSALFVREGSREE